MTRHSITRNCVTCNREFHPQPGNVRNGGGKYCSRACYFKGNTTPLLDRFFSYVGRKTEHGCILWTGGLSCGYANFSLSRCKSVRASHVAYELAYGPLPAGLFALHTCDNPQCINPSHLFAGTNSDNSKDMAAKGRSTKGEKHGMAKLSNEQVLEIRRRYRVGGIFQRELAKEFGVTQTLIGMIVRRKVWSHV